MTERRGIALVVPEDAPPLSRERRARVWLWLAHMSSLEQDDLLYAHPRAEGWEVEHERLAESGQACVDKAQRVVPGSGAGRLYAWAVDSFSREDPTYHPPRGDDQ